jgi:GDP-4-dehydro-6-deoxy-D-mannose reductase
VRILVTGAGGFVGGHLIPRLRAAFPGATLLAASRSGAANGCDEGFALDLLRTDELAAVLREAQPDTVVHLAAQANVQLGFADSLGTWKINLLGTLALADAVRQAVPQAGFIQASSAEVYGLSFQSGTALTEDAPLRPANPYAASKAAADLAIGEMTLRGLRAVRLRPFTHTGRGQSPGFVVSAFARQIALIEAGQQEPVIKVGALDRWRDFLDVGDVCGAYVAAIDALRDPASPASGAAFNIASGHMVRVGDVLSQLVALSSVQVTVQEEQTLLRPTDVISTLGNSDAARRVLHWQPRVPFAETLQAVLEDWRQRVRQVEPPPAR